jgi:hypothetical protein
VEIEPEDLKTCLAVLARIDEHTPQELAGGRS